MMERGLLVVVALLAVLASQCLLASRELGKRGVGETKKRQNRTLSCRGLQRSSASSVGQDEVL